MKNKTAVALGNAYVKQYNNTISIDNLHAKMRADFEKNGVGMSLPLSDTDACIDKERKYAKAFVADLKATMEEYDNLSKDAINAYVKRAIAACGMRMNKLPKGKTEAQKLEAEVQELMDKLLKLKPKLTKKVKNRITKLLK